MRKIAVKLLGYPTTLQASTQYLEYQLPTKVAELICTGYPSQGPSLTKTLHCKCVNNHAHLSTVFLQTVSNLCGKLNGHRAALTKVNATNNASITDVIPFSTSLLCSRHAPCIHPVSTFNLPTRCLSPSPAYLQQAAPLGLFPGHTRHMPPLPASHGTAPEAVHTCQPKNVLPQDPGNHHPWPGLPDQRQGPK